MHRPFTHRLLALLCLCTALATASPRAQAQSSSTQSGAHEFDRLLDNAALWNLTPDEFQSASAGLPFAWTSSAKDSARASKDSKQSMSLFSVPVVEYLARFEAGKLSQMTAIFYARGDAGSLTKDQYEALVRKCVESLTQKTAAKPVPRGKDPTNAVKADGIMWQNPKGYFLLEYSAVREVKTRNIDFRAEFVRLEITSPQKKTTGFATAPTRPRFTGALHIERNPASGEVRIKDVPMVDQGQKGYCVVASTERVMRYYGAEVDANELAQIANSDAERGTSSAAMLSALKKTASRLKVRVREVEEQDVKGILELIKDYNRAAKRAKSPELPDPGRMIDVGAIYSRMQLPILKDARTHNKADLDRFQRKVQTHVDQGIPLLWGVQLGLVSEKGVPQSGGGHMRLIIGYNTKTKEILFSDSWGAGHECKSMAMDDAWTITTGLTVIEPL